MVGIELSEEEALNEWIQLVSWAAERVILHLQRHQDGEVLALVTNQAAVADYWTYTLQMMLDWMWRDVLSTCCDDYVFDSTCYLQTEVLVEVASVSSVEVAFAVEGFLVQAISLEVAHEHISALDANFSSAFDIRIEDFY